MKKAVLIPVLLLSILAANAQSDTAKAPQYHMVKTYVSFIIPWVTINKNTTTAEFQTATTIGFPIGILVYSDGFAAFLCSFATKTRFCLQKNFRNEQFRIFP